MRDYDHIIVGLNGAPIVPGELILRDGHAQWDTDLGPEFIIDKDDPRYVAGIDEAKKLKVQFPLEGLNPLLPSERETITTREKAITTTLVDVIHAQFGDYNPAVAGGGSAIDDPSLHGDAQRKNTDNPAHLKEFEKDQLICRHYAPLFSALATEAGLSNLCVSGDSFAFEQKDGVITPSVDSSTLPAGHTFVVSRLTGNVMDATYAKGKDAYLEQGYGLSVDDIIAGKTIIIPVDAAHFESYGSQFIGIEAQREVLAKRQALIVMNRLEDLPSYTHPGAAENPIQYGVQVAEYDQKLLDAHYHGRTEPPVAIAPKTALSETSANVSGEISNSWNPLLTAVVGGLGGIILGITGGGGLLSTLALALGGLLVGGAASVAFNHFTSAHGDMNDTLDTALPARGKTVTQSREIDTEPALVISQPLPLTIGAGNKNSR